MVEINSSKISRELLIEKIEEEVNKIESSLREKNEVSLVDSEEFLLPVYTVEDFVKYHDIDFITFAYRVILGREPDENGLNHYLDKLRRGEYTKTDILVRLRYSKEGRKRKVKILGLRKRALYSYLSSVPVVGYFVKTVKFFATIPRFMRHFNALESHVHYYLGYVVRRIENLDNDITNVKRNFESRFVEINKTLLNLDETMQTVNRNISKLEQEVKVLKKNLTRQNIKLRNIDSNLTKLEKNFIQTDVPQKFEIDVSLEINRNRVYYSAFEEVFRGKESEIKERQRKYLKYIPKELSNKFPVLDVGCGRGEFLELLMKEGIEGIGVDINNEEIESLKRKGFKVFNKDVVSFLKGTDKIFSAIVSFQVIEHFSQDYLKEFLQLSYEKLTEGGVIILETVNPWNYEAFARFYIDETHVRPIPPDTLSFILSWIGFTNIKVIFSAPLRNKKYRDEDLKKLYIDYAIVGYKKHEG